MFFQNLDDKILQETPSKIASEKKKKDIFKKIVVEIIGVSNPFLDFNTSWVVLVDYTFCFPSFRKTLARYSKNSLKYSIFLRWLDRRNEGIPILSCSLNISDCVLYLTMTRNESIPVWSSFHIKITIQDFVIHLWTSGFNARL